MLYLCHAGHNIDLSRAVCKGRAGQQRVDVADNVLLVPSAIIHRQGVTRPDKARQGVTRLDVCW